MKINLEIIKMIFEIFVEVCKFIILLLLLIWLTNFCWSGHYISIINLDNGQDTTIVWQGIRNFFYNE